jgi:hypothetical protein
VPGIPPSTSSPPSMPCTASSSKLRHPLLWLGTHGRSSYNRCSSSRGLALRRSTCPVLGRRTCPAPQGTCPAPQQVNCPAAVWRHYSRPLWTSWGCSGLHEPRSFKRASRRAPTLRCFSSPTMATVTASTVSRAACPFVVEQLAGGVPQSRLQLAPRFQ